jgi:hypothetical protein
MDDRIKRETTRNSRGDDSVKMSAVDTLDSSKQRRKMFRDFSQEALPNPPAKEGWHFIWLSTTNQYDPIYKRMRMGYEPVKAEEMPDFKNFRINSGEFEGMISVNEMILFKIPSEIYQEIMEEYHHNMPLEEEERLKANAVGGERDSNGRVLGVVEGEGIHDLGARIKTPVFN